MWVAVVITALVLFGVGAYKARTMVGHPGKSGLEMAVIGTIERAGRLCGRGVIQNSSGILANDLIEKGADMSRLAVFFLMIVAPALSICLALLGLETLGENMLGWFLLVFGIAYPAGGVIFYFIRREPFWESQGCRVAHPGGKGRPFVLVDPARIPGCFLCPAARVDVWSECSSSLNRNAGHRSRAGPGGHIGCASGREPTSAASIPDMWKYGPTTILSGVDRIASSATRVIPVSSFWHSVYPWAIPVGSDWLQWRCCCCQGWRTG